MKPKVVSLAKRKEDAHRDKLAALLADVWQKTLAQIEAEFPDVGVIGVQYDILQTPNHWWTSCWSARLKKLYYRDSKGKKRFMRDTDMYADIAKFRKATSKQYRMLAHGQPSPAKLRHVTRRKK